MQPLLHSVKKTYYGNQMRGIRPVSFLTYISIYMMYKIGLLFLTCVHVHVCHLFNIRCNAANSVSVNICVYKLQRIGLLQILGKIGRFPVHCSILLIYYCSDANFNCYG